MSLAIIGARFGRLVLIEHFGPGKKRRARYKCDCGRVVDICYQNVRLGKQTSCGCLRRELARSRRRIHGGSGTREYNSWLSARERCNNPHNRAFKNYGGKGIAVCSRWDSFEAFFADMGPRPVGMTLERKDTSKGYTPENCRWATDAEQAVNKRANHRITAFGKTLTISQWSRVYGIYGTTIADRLKRGWPPEKAVNQPARRRLPRPPDTWGFYANPFGA